MTASKERQKSHTFHHLRFTMLQCHMKRKYLQTKEGRLYASHKLFKHNIDKFFNSSQPKTLPHLCKALKVNVKLFAKHGSFSDKFAQTVSDTLLACETWGVEQAMYDEKSFGKWYVERYHARPKIESSEDGLETILVLE